MVLNLDLIEKVLSAAAEEVNTGRLLRAEVERDYKQGRLFLEAGYVNNDILKKWLVGVLVSKGDESRGASIDRSPLLEFCRKKRLPLDRLAEYCAPFDRDPEQQNLARAILDLDRGDIDVDHASLVRLWITLPFKEEQREWAASQARIRGGAF